MKSERFKFDSNDVWKGYEAAKQCSKIDVILWTPVERRIIVLRITDLRIMLRVISRTVVVLRVEASHSGIPFLLVGKIPAFWKLFGGGGGTGT